MRILIRDISPEGTTLNDNMSLERLNARMAEGTANDILFLQPPHVQLVIRSTQDGAEAKGVIKTCYEQPCSLCLKKIEKSLEVKAHFIVKPKCSSDSEQKKPDDTEILYYEGDHVDLEERLQETIILSLSRYLQPPKNEQGECLLCGLNFTEKYGQESAKKNSLKKLLKEAGIK